MLLGVPRWRLIVHDWSKFLPSEWMPYVDYFYGVGSSDQTVFNKAWLFHQRRHPHHWQFWVLLEDSGKITPLEIPDVFVREMISDWIGAGAALGKSDVNGWYQANKAKMILHPETRKLVEFLLTTV